MKKIDAINELKPFLDEVIVNWGFADRHIDEVRLRFIKWLNNFETYDEVKLAFELAKVIHYKNDNDISEIVKELAGNLRKEFDNDFSDVFFFSLGESSNCSGSIFLYKYSKELQWSVTDKNFPYDNFSKYIGKKIVFFDDVIGSGNQAIKFASKHFLDVDVKPYYVSVFGLKDGVDRIKESGLFARVLVGERISNSERAFHTSSKEFDASVKEKIQSLCETYGRELYSDSPLGYDDSQLLLTFSHNTPNNTLPVIWSGTESESNPELVWYPLFPRKKVSRQKPLESEKQTISSRSEQVSHQNIHHPSFNKIKIECGNIDAYKADDFYDGMPCKYEDILSNYDIPRTLYNCENGIKNSVRNSIVAASGESRLIAIKGKNGVGKSTVLKRMCFDFYSECVIYEFNGTNLSSTSLSKQINDIALVESSPLIVIFDDADRITKCNLKPSDLFNSVDSDCKNVILVFAEQSNRWNFIERSNELRRKVGRKYSEFIIQELDDVELVSMADKTVELEKNGKIGSVKCALSRDERICLCSSNDNRLIIVSLLMFRYGKHMSSIIETEYDEIPTKEGKSAYSLVCLLSMFSISAPMSLIDKSSGDGRPDTNKKIRDSIDGLVYIDEVNYTYKMRHSLLSKYLFSYVFSTSSQISSSLISTFGQIDLVQSSEKEFAVEFFSMVDIQKKLYIFLNDDRPIVDFFESVINYLKGKSSNSEVLKFTYASYARYKEYIKSDHTGALELFRSALKIDDAWSFCLRQMAWTYSHLGDHANSSKYARLAIDASPNEFKNLRDCAYLLSLGDVESFKFAGKIYDSAQQIDPNDESLNKKIENYKNAKCQLDYLIISDDDLLPDEIIKAVNPGPLFWKVRKGINSKEFSNSLVRELSRSLQGVSGVIDFKLEAQLKGINISSNRLLSALYRAYSARQLYNRWYHMDENIDTSAIGVLYQESLKMQPTEPLVRAWYSTYIKECVGDYNLAKNEINRAIVDANSSKYEHLHDHPLLLNNKALIYMDGYHKGLYEKDVLCEAEILLNQAIKKIEDRDSNFNWPYDSLERLNAMKKDAGI